MKKSFHLTKIAASMSLVFGSSLIISADVFANSCTTFSAAGTCGLTEYQMTSQLSPVPTAWYFTSPTQDAAINGQAEAKNIYFASGTSSRKAEDLQQLLVDGANLSGYYINASKTGSAIISLKNNASVDWIEAGSSLYKTNTKIILDDSVLNGANAEVDYDKTNKSPFSKNYARGHAIYLSPADSGNTDIDIRNGSQVTGRIYTGGGGTHDITLEDSGILAGGIKIASSTNRNNINVVNSEVNTRGAVLATDNAIDISNASKNSSTQTIAIDNSQIMGSVALSSSGSTNVLSVNDSTITHTTQAQGNAITLAKGATTALSINNGQINGHAALSGTENLSVALDGTQIDGNLIASQAALIAIDITRSVLNGDIDAGLGSGTVALNVTDSSVAGDVKLNGGNVLSSDVWLTNASVAGHLYGGGQNSTLHLAGVSQFDGAQFSQFSNLNVSGDLTLAEGFSDANVGAGLNVSGDTLIAPVQLSTGKLAFDNTRLVSETFSLQAGASLVMANQSQLQTRSDQLFNASASEMLPEGFNEAGARLTLADSTLILSDDLYHLDYVKAVNELINVDEANTLVMLGTLQNAEQVAGTATVADASTVGAVLANTQVTSGKNTLIIGAKNATTDDSVTARNGFGAAQLRFEGKGDPSVYIGGDQTLTLTGAMGGALIDVAGAPDAAVDVTVDNGALNLGTTAINNVNSHLKGNITVTENGVMNVDAGEHTIVSGNGGAGIISSGVVNVNSNAVLHADMKMQDAAKLAVNGALQAGLLTASEGVQITVGDAQASGLLVADRLDLQGASVFIDPAWVEGGTLADASRMLSGGNEVNGRMSVGQNALLVLGDTSDASAIQHFAETGLHWGSAGVTAALAIEAPQTLSALQGRLRIDGSQTINSLSSDVSFNTAEFAERSLLMANSQDMTNGKAALSADKGTLRVADTAALYVADAKANQSYVVTQGFDDVQIEGNGWQNGNLLMNKLLNATTREANGQVIVSTQARAAQDVMPGVVTTHALDTLIASGENSLTAPYAGQRFLSVAIDTPEASVEQVVKNVNSAAQMAISGGVQSSTLAVGTSAINAILDRNSVTHSTPRVAESDASVWVQTLYGNQRSSGQQAGVMHYGHDSDFYGLMMGADKEYETSLGLMRSGMAFHAGNGDTNSRGDFNATHNDFSFWGASLYQTWRHNALNITGEMSLTQSSNDLYQKQPDWLKMGDKLKANVDSQLFSVGLRGEYLVETNAVDFIPHVGARFNQLTTQSFDTKSQKGENIFHTDKGTQNIWQFPVGVKVNKNVALDSGWKMSTQADLGVIAVAGDKSARSTLHTVGISARDMISAEVMDSTAFNGQAGLTLQKGNMTFGVGYTISASSHDTGQAVSATYKLDF